MKDRIGRYQIGELIASGGMAEVHHAMVADGPSYGAPIVVKRMHDHLSEDPNFISMFVDEARVYTRFDHPNIVRLLDFSATEEGVYMILEFVDGPDLLSLLKAAARKRTPMPPNLAVYIVCHVLEALDYAHTCQAIPIIHRDISPGNILISASGRVKLADFGIARVADREINEEAVKGKYGYMSPEQIESRDLDGRSDVFSCGIVLAELLTSSRLFVAPNQLDQVLMVRQADTKRFDRRKDDFDPALTEILYRSLERERENRFATAGDFRDALAGWLSVQPSRSTPQKLQEYCQELQVGGFVTKPNSNSLHTLNGENTSDEQESSTAAAAIGRKMFVSLPSEDGDDGLDLTLGAAGGGTSSAPRAASAVVQEENNNLNAGSALDAGEGKLGPLRPIDLFGAIAGARRTGLLTVRRGDMEKRAYFVNGDPVYVTSTDPSEYFGQFLVQQKAITSDELRRALATMDHFGGHLGQAIVGLGLLKPVETVTYLAEQVSGKLIRAATWDSGDFSWVRDATNPYPAVALHLSGHRIVARSVQGIPKTLLADWAARIGDQKIRLDPESFDRFGFGPSLRARLELLDGTRSCAQFLADSSVKSRPILQSALYAMVCCGQLELA